jgi:hypothetical protein
VAAQTAAAVALTGGQRKAWSLVGRAVKAGDATLSRLATGVQVGVIDFDSGGCLLARRVAGRERSNYHAPGTQLSRDRPGGQWRERTRRGFTGSRAYAPVWLVELPRGAIEVTLAGEELVDGELCRHARGAAELRLARLTSRHGMDSGSIRPRAATARLSIDVWVDPRGRLRRVRCVQRFVTFEVRLSDFGGVPPLSAPAVAG